MTVWQWWTLSDLRHRFRVEDSYQSAFTNPQEYATYINSEIFQTFKLAQELLQLGVDLQVLGFGVFEEGPEFLQSVKLA